MIWWGRTGSRPAQKSRLRELSTPRRILASFSRILAVCVAGILLGLLLTFLAIERGTGIGTVEAGPWTYRPSIGTTEIDPYTRAMLARSGELPLGAAEGLSITARGDSAGATFDPGCDYVVAGAVPRARYWTLSVHSPEGDLVANAAGRYGFTSAEILRSADGGFEIIVAPRARPGNWLPNGNATRFVLVLRLYDTELDTRSAPLDGTALPRITKLRCR